jgi:hypothetical protein
MIVADLRGFTQESLMAFVEDVKKGPSGLVPAWLVDQKLEPFLKNYVKPEDLASEAKRARSGSGFEKPVMAVVSYESMCTLFPAPPADRFKRVAPLGGRPYFDQTECRQAQFGKVLSTWCESWSKTDMGKEPLVVTSGAPGDGKTRFVWTLAQRGTSRGEKDLELETVLGAMAVKQQRFVELIRNAIGVTVTFNFSSQVKAGEDPNHMLGTRMLYSHFCRDGKFQDFRERVIGHFGRGVSATEALGIIREDIDRQFPGEKRAIILAVDELLMSGQETIILGSVGELMELPEEQRLFFPIVTHLSPERVAFLATKSDRPLFLVMNTPLDDPAVSRLKGSLKHRAVLEWPSFSSVLRDCGGVPRCLEYVCLAAESANVERMKHRETIVYHLCENQGYFARFLAGKWKPSAERAIFFAFSGWAVDKLGAKLQLNCEREELFTNGVLHVLSPDAYSKYGVPPIFCYIWRELAGKYDLLAAIIEFLELDGVGPAPVDQGPRFELQVGALFRILSAADECVRKEADLVAEDLVPKHRSILGLVNRPGFRCVAEAFGRARVVQAFMRPLVPNEYLLQKHRFFYGDDLALLPGGRYMPNIPNHEGFDLLLVDHCRDDSLVFFSAIECKFSQEKESGSVSSYARIGELAKKFVDTLLRYPCLVDALLAGRFCFIVASFQGVSKKGGVEEFADLVFKGIKAAKVKSPSEITMRHVLDALVLLRRDHIKQLLTPTLDSRMHFFCNE